jgi:type IV pilus assembly protein PilC
MSNEVFWPFAAAMADCLSAGMPPERALRLSGGRSTCGKLREVVEAAAGSCAKGTPLVEALRPHRRVLPAFVLPVLEAGEETGHLPDAFALLQSHSLRIAPSLRLVRNSWLYPVTCILFGWLIRTGMLVYFGRSSAAWQFALSSFGTMLVITGMGLFLLRLPAIKRFLDTALLHVPVVRESQIQVSLMLFFSTFRMGYEAGGLPVLRVFDLALHAIRNTAVQTSVLKARSVLEQNGTFGDAFNEVDVLADDIKSIIYTGNISGRLNESCGQVVEKTRAELEVTLTAFNQIFQRVVSVTVAMSIVETVLICTI